MTILFNGGVISTSKESYMKLLFALQVAKAGAK